MSTYYSSFTNNDDSKSMTLGSTNRMSMDISTDPFNNESRAIAMPYQSFAPDQGETNISRLLEGDRKYNGRVDIATAIGGEDPEIRFKMHEEIALKNRASNYFESLNGSWEWNVLAQVYFSAENIQIVQNGIRAGVYKMSDGKFNVPPQNIDIVKIVMRSIYLQYAEHYPTDITGQVEYLNKIVLEYAVPNVFNEAVAYYKYVQDQSSMAVPFERFAHDNDRVFKQLQTRPFI